MLKPMRLEDLKDMDLDDEILEDYSDKSSFSNYSKSIAIKIAYLLGVRQDFIFTIDESAEDIFNELTGNMDATIIRALNNLRSNIILNFKRISRTIRISANDYQPIYKIDILENDFKTLKKYNIEITTGRQDLNEYLERINTEIQRHIDFVSTLFPDWIEFKHIKFMFNMPTNKIKEESEKYQSNQNYYPYKRYFYWRKPIESGNILISDVKLLYLIYQNDKAYFQDADRVVDASDNVKNNINHFINNGNKIQIFVDGENCDPYRLAAMFDSLKGYEIQKIDKVIVYYDELNSSKAWLQLKFFTYNVEVETIAVERIKEDKSLVDHKLVAGVSKAVYKDDVDSIILASSDSDFWSVIEDVDANYLVLLEKTKCGSDFKSLLWNNNIFYCYLDKFMTPEKDKFFDIVFKKELEKVIANSFVLPNAEQIFREALTQTRASLSSTARDHLYNTAMNNLKLVLNSNGTFSIEIMD